jgi:hypothetical protein
MDKIIAISSVVGLLILGLIRILKDYFLFQEKIQSVTEFLNKFEDYLESQGNDFNSYSWLMKKSPKVQSDMGGYGIAAQFRTPYAHHYTHVNYPLILNIIPEIRKELSQHSSLQNIAALREYEAIIHESIWHYTGVLNEYLDQHKKRLKNPAIWFTEGISWLLLLPISILSWVGLFGETLVRKIARNQLFKILAGLVTLLGAVSTIMTIVIGWDAFMKTLKMILSIP